MSNLTLNPTRNLTLANRAVLIAAPHVRLSDEDLMAVAMADATAPAPATDFGGVA